MGIKRQWDKSLRVNQLLRYNLYMDRKWVQIYSTYGRLNADMLVDFLNANGIEATSIQESVGTTYGITVGTLGEAIIYVPVDKKEAAEELLQQMEDGKLELTDDFTPTEPDQINRNSD